MRTLNAGHLNWLAPSLAVMLFTIGGCQISAVARDVAVYGRWGEEAFQGLAIIRFDRSAVFEMHSLRRPDLTCRVTAKLGAMGFGDGTADCGPKQGRVPVQVYFDEQAQSITVLVTHATRPVIPVVDPQ